MTEPRRYPQVKALRRREDLDARLTELGLSIPIDDEVQAGPGATLARPLPMFDQVAGNRFAVLPMEGWDGTEDGRPTDLVTRRWERFGRSGAKVIWGGEAVAVRPDGRANPRQLRIGPDTVESLAVLRAGLVAVHEAAFGRADDLVVGLQLTHSGRWARPGPDGRPRPRTAARSPVLDVRVGAESAALLDDDELDGLVDAFVDAAVLAADAGFAFVDVKACHGYLGHELLGAVGRAGRYGGDFDGRTRFLRTIVERIRQRVPGLGIGVRLSAFDPGPYRSGPDGVGEPDDRTRGEWSPFGGAGDPRELDEAHRLLDTLAALGVGAICLTAGSPYTNPHVQRPAYFPPSDGYRPPEDPLVGVARQLAATAALKAAHPDLVLVGSGYSYLQEWLAHAAQAAVRLGHVDAVGYGRLVLSYPELAADVLAGRPVDRRRLCRTFSDCTTAPRNGMVSGCFPLDPFYKAMPERGRLVAVKRAGRPAGEEGDET